MSNLSMTYGTAKNLTKNTFTKSGYTFLGWSTTSSATSATYTDGQSVNNLTTTNGATINLYAIWRKTITITYNANGGSGAPGSQTAYAYNANTSASITISSTAPTKSGYTFLGWSRSSTATSATYSSGTAYTFSSSTTLYAIWKKTITITYNANGGSGAPGTQSGNVYNSNTSYTFTISSTKPTRSGYIFQGWADSSSATSAAYQSGSTLTISSNKTIYAVWVLAVAQIGSTQYPSIQTAMNAVPSTNVKTSVLLLVTTTENFSIGSNKYVDFNLNGKTINGLCTNNGNLIISNGTMVGDGNGTNEHTIYNNGIVTITSGTYKINQHGNTIQNSGTLNMSGGTVELSSGYGTAIYNAKTLNITGGTVKSSEYGIVSANSLNNGQIVAVANLSNATISGTKVGVLIGNSDGTNYYYGRVKGTGCNITGSSKFNTASHDTSIGVFINCGGSGSISGRVVTVSTNSSGYDIAMYDSGSDANVQFPTWTSSGGQDDLVWHSGTFHSGNYWTCRINRSQHNNESGTYITHVYRYENGKQVCVTTDITLNF